MENTVKLKPAARRAVKRSIAIAFKDHRELVAKGSTGEAAAVLLRASRMIANLNGVAWPGSAP